MFVFLQKIGIGLSVQLLGLLLTFAGYRSFSLCNELSECLEQPTSALITIRLCMGLIPAILVLTGLLLMKNWPNKEAHLQINS